MSFEEVAWARIQVVGDGRIHKTGPIISDEQIYNWHLWISVGLPLSPISWDPREQSWLAVRSYDEPVSFFEYIVQIGWHILLH